MADWSKIKSRGKVNDMRGASGGAALGGMGLVGLAALIIVPLLFGGEIDFNNIANQLNDGIQPTLSEEEKKEFEGEDDYELFASQVLGSNNDLWSKVFKANNLTYNEPTLTLFRNSVSSACGGASSAIGPHYCPIDKTIYLDEGFFETLEKRFGAEGGDVAEAYVIAHEVGHHIQNEIGLLSEVRAVQNRKPSEANELSVKMELMADCYAGVWANSIVGLGIFDSPDEIKEAIDAAAAVGDDRIQAKTTGRVNPEGWTHGSSEDRVLWFERGYVDGSPNECDTF